MKYQFCIVFKNTTVNSAATKAVLDCNRIFSAQGYKDYTTTVWDNANRLKYYMLLVKELLKFYAAIKKGSVVGIQYPLLSVHHVFVWFIKLARVKGVKFFCIIHDLEALRKGGQDEQVVKAEIANLNTYDAVIAHNPKMIAWLQAQGIKTKVINLGLFDYLVADTKPESAANFEKTIVFAGNLSKSTFVYNLPKIEGWKFNVYGPNFQQDEVETGNLTWCGQYSPEQIVTELRGSFGLIWDGQHTDKCDEILGNYLNYNNPHKFSLYLAAGLPVIAPEGSAIGEFIKQHEIGLLVKSLHDLPQLQINDAEYKQMKDNVTILRAQVISGQYFTRAVKETEAQLAIAD